MKYSTKLSDALHILAFLSMGAGQRITSAKIAESVKTNPAYIRQLSAALKRAGLVDSAQGQANPSLIRSPAQVTVRRWRGTNRYVYTNPACAVGVYVQQSIADFYGEIQTTAEERMQAITLQDILDRYHQKLETVEGAPDL